mgnify:CR=1 FL=1
MAGIYSGWEWATYRQFLEKFELPKDKKIKDFSKGMKVKLAFAVALSHKAELLILDEATSGLDPIIRDDVLDMLIDFVQDENHSVLVSSHITSDLEKVADYITFIHKGKLVFSHDKDDLVDNYGIVSCGSVIFDTLDKTDTISFHCFPRRYIAVSFLYSSFKLFTGSKRWICGNDYYGNTIDYPWYLVKTD